MASVSPFVPRFQARGNHHQMKTSITAQMEPSTAQGRTMERLAMMPGEVGLRACAGSRRWVIRDSDDDVLWFIVDVAAATPWRYKLFSVKCGCGIIDLGNLGNSGVT